MENVLDIISNYSKEHKFLDKEAVLLICKMLINQYNIDNISSINIDKSHRPHSTHGYCKGKEIGICLPHIYSFIKNEDFDKEFKDDFDNYLKCNWYILHTILHELEHAKQRIKIKSNDNDMEKKLLRLEYEYIIEMLKERYDSLKKYFNYKKKSKTYKILYLIQFSERMAEINSNNKGLEIIKPIKDEKEELYDFFENHYIASKICTYPPQDKYPGPTDLFFKYIDKREELNKIKPSILSYEDRLNYGFELTTEEVKKTLELIKKHK